MMDPDLNEKVPCFLTSVALTIFKAGSSLHLLTRQELQHELSDHHSVRLYFDICTSGLSIAPVPPHPTLLDLSFDLASLKSLHSLTSWHFET
jgi:hypothetical protein